MTDKQLFFVSVDRQLTSKDDVTALLEDIRAAENSVLCSPLSSRPSTMGVRYYYFIIQVTFESIIAGLCSTQIFRADSTLTHVTIQVTQL